MATCHSHKAPGTLYSSRVGDLDIKHRALVAIDGVSVEPWHAAYAVYLSLFSLPPVAHVPVASFRVGADHLEPRAGTTGVIQQPMGHPSRQDDDVSGLDDGLDPPRVVFPAETQPCAPGADAQDFVRVAVEVAGGVHCIAPLGHDDAHRGQVRFYCRSGWLGGERRVVDEEWFVLDGAVWQEAVRGDQVLAHAQCGEGGGRCG